MDVTLGTTDRHVAFRVDSSPMIGIGHVMRCKTLADGLRRQGIDSLFLCRAIPAALRLQLLEAGHHVIDLPSDGPPPADDSGLYGRWLGTTQEHDAQAVISLLDGLSCRMLVIDHYGLDLTCERQLRAGTGLPLLAIDDLRRPHETELLLDVTLGRMARDYTGLVPETCRILAGVSFALLRPDFKTARAASLASRAKRLVAQGGVRSLLLALGGADPHNIAGSLLSALIPHLARRKLHVDILVGAAFEKGADLAKLTRSAPGRITIHANLRAVAPVLARADLCIGACGSASWERCCMGLPTLNLVVADNQRTIASRLTTAGIGWAGDVVATDGDGEHRFAGLVVADWLRSRLWPLLDDVPALALCSERAAGLVDGLGTARVIDALRHLED